MRSSRPQRTTVHRTRIRTVRVLWLLAGVAAIAAALSSRLPASPAPPETPAPTVPSPVRAPRAAGLDPALQNALDRAAADAAAEGVDVVVESGRRTPQHQQRLLDEAVAKYGSEEQAARWVARPERSAHVSGDAVDLGPAAARTWLAQRGAEYGLCPIYANEPWHFELRPEAVDHGCPAAYDDPTHDPRMKQ